MTVHPFWKEHPRLAAVTFGSLALFIGYQLLNPHVKTPQEVEQELNSAAQSAAAIYGGRMKFAVKKILKDPDSAKFSKMTVEASGRILCGWLNAKNSFGGYTGPERFAYSPAVGYVSDSEVADKLCTNSKYNFYRIRSLDD